MELTYEHFHELSDDKIFIKCLITKTCLFDKYENDL